jgi:DUF1365 family protein
MDDVKSDGLPASALYRGRVSHVRLRPIRHRLSYRIFMMLLDLDELPALARRTCVFGHNRAGLVSFFERDHGDGSALSLKEQIAAKAEAAQCGDLSGGKIYALCMPRVLGYVFNPLTLYFCSDRAGLMRAIVYEVNNTFGERHFYTLSVDGEGRIRQDCAKGFRVSPFMDMNLRYRFSIERPGERIGVNIIVSDAKGPVLTATFSGARRALNSAAIVRELLLHPAMTFKVIAGIHWEALLIWLKLRRASRASRRATHAEVTRG